MARARKTGVDQLLMKFKKSNPDFHHLIRNGKDDITVLMKRMSEGLHMPYRKFDIENLGAISPLKTRSATKENGDEEVMTNRESEDGFSLPRRTKRHNFIPKNEIFDNINSFLDGISEDCRRQRERGSPRR